MTKINAWVMASRPKTLFAGIGPVLLGLALNYHLYQSLNLPIALLTLVCVVLMQTGTNLVNDYFDNQTGIDDQNRLGPQRALHLGLLSSLQIKRGYQTCFLLALILGVFLMIHGGPIIVFIGLSSLFFAYIYTAGPFPLSHYALGELTALIYFGPIAVWGTAYLQNAQISFEYFSFGLSVGWISAAIMAVNNLRDRKSDAQKNKLTLAVFLGEKGGRLLCLSFIALSALWPILYSFKLNIPSLLITSLIPLIFIKQWKRLYTEPISEEFNNILANTGKYLFLYSLIFSLILILRSP